MLVDDDAALLHALSFSFSTQGYDVHAYSDAEALLAAVEGTSQPACLVLDQRLPGRSGLELLAALRAKNVLAPAILMTSNPSTAVRSAAAAAGAEIVEKPLLGHALESKVRDVIAGR